MENERFVELAEKVKEMTAYAERHALTIAVMGCRVNGPGETDDGHQVLEDRPVPALEEGLDRVVLGGGVFSNRIPRARSILKRSSEQSSRPGIGSSL